MLHKSFASSWLKKKPSTLQIVYPEHTNLHKNRTIIRHIKPQIREIEDNDNSFDKRDASEMSNLIAVILMKWYGFCFAFRNDSKNLFHFQVPLDVNDVDGSMKKGLLWQQRDKLFSRWKERYFILTKDYFHCFKKGTSRITEMGGFIFKVSINCKLKRLEK